MLVSASDAAAVLRLSGVISLLVVFLRLGVRWRWRGVCGLRVAHRRPLLAASERALVARDVRQVLRVSQHAQRDLLLQRPPALLQTRLRKVRGAAVRSSTL